LSNLKIVDRKIDVCDHCFGFVGWDHILLAYMTFWQEAQLWQRARATRCISWSLVNCCTAVQKSHLRMLAMGEWPRRLFKIIGNGAIQ